MSVVERIREYTSPSVTDMSSFEAAFGRDDFCHIFPPERGGLRAYCGAAPAAHSGGKFKAGMTHCPTCKRPLCPDCLGRVA